MIRRSLLITALLLTAWTARIYVGSPQDARHGSLSQVPAVMALWKGRDVPLEPDVLAQLATSDHLNRIYRSGSGSVGLYVAYYASQRAGEAVHSPMNCLPGSGWQPLQTERIGLDTQVGGPSATINEVVVENGIERALVLYWYQTPGRVTASEYLSKALMVKDAFSTGRTDVALVRIIVPIDSRDPNGKTKALNVALPFAKDVLPDVHKSLFQS